MKNITLSLPAALTLHSCDKFLELEPSSQGIAVTNTSSDSIFYKSASEAEAALAGAYSDFKNEYYQLDYFVNGDAQSDNAYAGGDNPANFQIDEFELNSTNSNVSRDWRYLYATIGKCNTVINNVRAVNDPAMTADRKEEIVGEASFIRALENGMQVILKKTDFKDDQILMSATSSGGYSPFVQENAASIRRRLRRDHRQVGHHSDEQSRRQRRRRRHGAPRRRSRI